MDGKFSGLLGIVVILFITYLCSSDRKNIPWKTVAWGLGLQIVFAVCILGIPRYGVPGIFRFVFSALNDLVNDLVGFTDAGADFVFGPLGRPDSPGGFIFAFRALPTIIFFSSLTAVLYHLGLLQKVVKGIALLLQKTMRASGAELLSTAANIFVGQTEAPLIVKPYIERMTRSEILCIMVGGMATVAAGVMAAYVNMLKGRVPDIAGHLLTASFMAAPGTIMISKMLLPEREVPETMGMVQMGTEKLDSNVIEAAARGAAEGLQLALNVAAMLIAFIALITLFDSVLGWAGAQFGFAHWGHHFAFPGDTVTAPRLSFSLMLGWLFAPLSWLLGIPWAESPLIGKLLGEKLILNEFVAYVHLSQVGAKLSDRSVIICSYALCGFANFASIGMQIGGIGTMAPNQRPTLARLGLLSVLGGSLTCYLLAAIAGLLF